MTTATRRGLLKGLAGLATVPLLGKFVVNDAEVVEGAKILVPDRTIDVPAESRIIVAKEMPAPVDYAEAYISNLEIEYPAYDMTSFGSSNRQYVQGMMTARAEVVFTGDLTTLFQHRAGSKVRVYFDRNG